MAETAVASSPRTHAGQQPTIGTLVDCDVITLQTGPFGSQLHSYDYVSSGVRVVPTEAIGLRRLNTAVMPQVSEAKAAELSRHRLVEGDILFARRGIQATGLSAIVDSENVGSLCGTGAIRLRVHDGNIVDPRWLSIYLASPAQREWLKTHAVGAVMPNLNEGIIKSMPLDLPPIQRQREVADKLGTFDDKIELNRKMSHTLEALARAIFKSWFVDFDPAVAKAAGRKPVGMSAETAALFPDSFQDSALGPIPKGWRVGTIADLADIVGGSTPGTNNPAFWDGGTIPWATPKDLSGKTAPVLSCTDRMITDAGLSQISSGLLPRGTVLLSSRAPIGYLAIADVPLAINQGFIAMKPLPNVSSAYLLFWARENAEEIESRANGTTFLEISKANFRPIPVILGSEDVLRAFNQQAETLISRLTACVAQIDRLEQFRDALLPSLLVGEKE